MTTAFWPRVATTLIASLAISRGVAFAQQGGSADTNPATWLRVRVEVSPRAKAQGIEIRTLKSDIVGRPSITREAFTCHVESKRPVDGLLIAKAVAADDQELARSSFRIRLRPKDGIARRYIRFAFDPEVDEQKAKKIIVDLEE